MPSEPMVPSVPPTPDSPEPREGWGVPAYLARFEALYLERGRQDAATEAEADVRMRPDQILGRAPLASRPEQYRGARAGAAPWVYALEGMALDLGDDLPGDLNATHCTTAAWYLRSQIAGTQIWGVTVDDNPDAAVHADNDGHDFAVVQGRYIVDPWAVHFAAPPVAADKYVHDLEDPRDAETIRRLYGDRSRWIDTNAFNDPQRTVYDDLEAEDLHFLAGRDKPGAYRELVFRGLVVEDASREAALGPSIPTGSHRPARPQGR